MCVPRGNFHQFLTFLSSDGFQRRQKLSFAILQIFKLSYLNLQPDRTLKKQINLTHLYFSSTPSDIGIHVCILIPIKTLPSVVELTSQIAFNHMYLIGLIISSIQNGMVTKLTESLKQPSPGSLIVTHNWRAKFLIRRV